MPTLLVLGHCFRICWSFFILLLIFAVIDLKAKEKCSFEHFSDPHPIHLNVQYFFIYSDLLNYVIDSSHAEKKHCFGGIFLHFPQKWHFSVINSVVTEKRGNIDKYPS